MSTEHEVTQELLDLAEEIVLTLMSKRKDYGTQNIAATGRYGISVRLLDKVSRLLNLTREGAEAPNHEALEDTYKDIIGYALIGLHGEGWGLDPLPRKGNNGNDD